MRNSVAVHNLPEEFQKVVEANVPKERIKQVKDSRNSALTVVHVTDLALELAKPPLLLLYTSAMTNTDKLIIFIISDEAFEKLRNITDKDVLRYLAKFPDTFLQLASSDPSNFEALFKECYTTMYATDAPASVTALGEARRAVIGKQHGFNHLLKQPSAR